MAKQLSGFSVGDRVKVVGYPVALAGLHGKEGVVVKITYHYLRVMLDGDETWYLLTPEEVEIVPKLSVGDKVRLKSRKWYDSDAGFWLDPTVKAGTEGKFIAVSPGWDDWYSGGVFVVSWQTPKGVTQVVRDIDLEKVEEKPVQDTIVKFGRKLIVNSSFISDISYSTDSRVLRVRFRHGGSAYYEDVPRHVFGYLASAYSVGGVYNSTVKGQFTTIDSGTITPVDVSRRAKSPNAKFSVGDYAVTEYGSIIKITNAEYVGDAWSYAGLVKVPGSGSGAAPEGERLTLLREDELKPFSRLSPS